MGRSLEKYLGKVRLESSSRNLTLGKLELGSNVHFEVGELGPFGWGKRLPSTKRKPPKRKMWCLVGASENHPTPPLKIREPVFPHVFTHFWASRGAPNHPKRPNGPSNSSPRGGGPAPGPRSPGRRPATPPPGTAAPRLDSNSRATRRGSAVVVRSARRRGSGGPGLQIRKLPLVLRPLGKKERRQICPVAIESNFNTKRENETCSLQQMKFEKNPVVRLR